MYKVLNKMGPKSLANLFSYKCEKTNYHLRDISTGLCLPKPRSNNMKNSFMYNGAKLWNSIPKEIRESKSLSSFRNKIAAHIKGALQSVCKQSLCLHFCVQNIELYSTTIYIFKLLEYNK